MEITIKLLENAIARAMKEGRTGEGWGDGKGRFLVDGFPRKMDQAVKFEEDVRRLSASGAPVLDIHFSPQVCPSAMTIFYEASVDVMMARLRKRGETSGREDDNDESIKKRLGGMLSHSPTAILLTTLHQ